MMRNAKVFSVAAITLSVAALVVPALAQDTLPAGPGMEETLKGCGGCHGITQILAEKRQAEEWSNTVTMMITLGAPVSNADFDKVVTYLATYFGPNPRPQSPQESSTPVPVPQ